MILTGKGPALGSLWVANLPLKVGLKLMLMYQLVLEDTLLLVEVFSGIKCKDGVVLVGFFFPEIFWCIRVFMRLFFFNFFWNNFISWGFWGLGR